MNETRQCKTTLPEHRLRVDLLRKLFWLACTWLVLVMTFVTFALLTGITLPYRLTVLLCSGTGGVIALLRIPIRWLFPQADKNS